MSRGHESDNELLLAARDDPEAFGRFYDRHVVALLGALRHRTGSLELAFDLTAETFARALEGCGRFAPVDERSARAWLYGIARNQLAEHYRRGGAEARACRRLGIRSVAVDETVVEAVDRRIDAEASGVAAALAELPAAEEAAIRARVIDDVAYADIADRTSVSESVIRQRVSRGLRRLRVSVKEQP